MKSNGKIKKIFDFFQKYTICPFTMDHREVNMRRTQISGRCDLKGLMVYGKTINLPLSEKNSIFNIVLAMFSR